MPSIKQIKLHGLLLLLAGTATALAAPVDFAHEIAPVLREHCAECHTGAKQKGGFSMNDRAALLQGSENGPVVEPGNSSASHLIKLIESEDSDEWMPPKGPRVSPEQVAILRRWIDAGLLWDEQFVFQKPAYEPPLRPRMPELPPAFKGRTNPVDRILDAYLAEHQVPRPPPVDDATFARRVQLDLTGLLPAPAALDDFLKDRSKDKRRRLVESLLADDVAYAEHWLTFWNDLLRNDYAGTGYIDGGRKQITTWLYRALLENMPYDQFARELVSPTPESEGFARGIKWRGSVSAGQSVPVQFAQSVGQTFLGLNLKCASCHDSFVDRWKLDDAYGLAAVYATEPLELFRCDKPTGRMAKAAWLFPELGQIDAAAPQPERLSQLATLLTHPDNGRFTRTIVNRLWHRLMGRGIVHPVDAMQSEPWSADLLDFLAAHLAAENYDLKQTLKLICTSAAYQSRTQTIGPNTDERGYVYAGPRARRMTAEQFVDALWQIGGIAPAKFDAPVIRGKHEAASARGSTEGLMPVRASLVKSDLLMRSLGRPNREQIVSSRPNELTTLEAIDLANGAGLALLIQRSATNILAAGEAKSPDKMIQQLYRAALSRPATREELALARGALGAKPDATRVEDLLWAMLMLPEFQLIR